MPKTINYEPLNKYRIIKMLDTLKPILKRLDILPTVDSTNTYLVHRRHFKGNYAVFAEQQTQGRGKLGNHWSSPPGNLYGSLLWHYSGHLQSISTLYQMSGQ